MKLGILGWDEQEHESIHLAEVARQLGHEATLFTLDDVTCTDWGGRLEVLVNDRPTADLDVILSRAQLRLEHWQRDLERLTLLSNVEGVPVLDPATAFVAAESKLIGMQELGRAGIPVPPTMACTSLQHVRAASERWGRIVVKPSFGFGGEDVERLNGDYHRARPLLERYGTILAQPFLPHPEGDIRVTVVGDDVAFSFRRIPAAGGWKANVAMGAHSVPYVPPPALQELAVRAARTMNITVAGLDVIRYGGLYVVLEINNVPGWHSLPEDKQFEAASRIIEWAVRNTCTR
jgi:ribosomal protein S6--L-glutamate ligase